MTRRSLWLGLIGLALALVVGGSAAASRNTIAALGSVSFLGVNQISCGAAGTCALGGYHRDVAGRFQAFVADEKDGIWGKAIEVPGSAALNHGSDAVVYSVSCATAGNCAAGGFYRDGAGHYQAFVVDETNGSWGNAVEVPGTATLNTGGGAGLTAVDCTTAGNCSAAGFYKDGAGHYQTFVVDETNGSWGNAIEVPGIAALNSGGDSDVYSISCSTAGDCTAAGIYKGGSGHYQAFVVDETSGTWGSAIEVPGSGALNSGGDAWVDSVSCAADGACTAAGTYKDGSDEYQAFVADETGGAWGTAIEIPGSAALNDSGNAGSVEVSCGSAGTCAAGGFYDDGSANQQAFVVDETGGTWGNAIKVPGSATLNTGGYAWTSSVSCAGSGTCAAAGYYKDGSGHWRPFVVDETSGSWGNAIAVSGSATLHNGGDDSLDLSCTTAGNCSAGGSFRAGPGHPGFVFDEVNGSWGGATTVKSNFPCVVPGLVGKSLRAAKRTLAAAYCRVGTIKKVFARAKAGRVVAQHPKRGTRLAHGAKVALTVSKGRS